MPAVAQDGQQPLEESQGAEVVEVATDSGGAFGGGGHGFLSAEPGDERFGLRSVPRGHGPVVAAQRGGEGRGGAGDGGEPVFQELVHRGREAGLVVVVDFAGREGLLLQGVQP